MEKIIKVGEQELKLNNNLGWVLEYRDQFGKDIIQGLMPMVSSMVSILGELLQETGKDEVGVDDVLRIADTDAMDKALLELSTMEFTEIINIIWALSKCADESIPEPKRWIKQFEVFELDVVLPEVIKLIIGGIVSTKNLQRLQDLRKRLKPVNS